MFVFIIFSHKLAEITGLILISPIGPHISIYISKLLLFNSMITQLVRENMKTEIH